MKTNNKTNEQTKIFPAKVLLFGEHTILRGSKALAIPYLQKNCYWSWEEKYEDDNLLQFAHYLQKNFPKAFYFQRLKEDIHQGLYLHSTIPSGYGLGSSGAVCVAVFHRCSTAIGQILLKQNPTSFFAKMEGFFHGDSSGTDPLIIYHAQSICLYDDGNYALVDIPPLAENNHLFLYDTQHARKTGPLVDRFVEKYDKEKNFSSLVDENWSKPTDLAIDALLAANIDQLWIAFEQISDFQLNQLINWVLPSLHNLWKNGLESQDYLLKICGAGGGGYCLGICKDIEKVKNILGENRVIDLTLST